MSEKTHRTTPSAPKQSDSPPKGNKSLPFTETSTSTTLAQVAGNVPHTLTPQSVQLLQRTVGNRAVEAWFRHHGAGIVQPMRKNNAFGSNYSSSGKPTVKSVFDKKEEEKKEDKEEDSPKNKRKMEDEEEEEIKESKKETEGEIIGSGFGESKDTSIPKRKNKETLEREDSKFIKVTKDTKSSNEEVKEGKKEQEGEILEDMKDEEILENLEEEEEEEELAELTGGQRFWARAVVRAKSQAKPVKVTEVEVYEISISPERRDTVYGREKNSKALQGAHLVAWSAMVRFWTGQLKGGLGGVLNLLEQFIIADQIADEDIYEENKPRRARAFFLVQELKNKAFPIDTVLDMVEEAVSLFIISNQFSSFAVHGKSFGGNAEGDAHQVLSDENENPSKKGEELVPYALKLIDLKLKKLDKKQSSKAISTWFMMTKAQYPKIWHLMEDHLLKQVMMGDSVLGWLKEWEEQKKKGGKDAILAMAEMKPTVANFKFTPDIATGVRVVANGMPQSQDKEILPEVAPKLKADEVQIQAVEIPAKLRAPTKFGTAQQSHTLAWTFKRQSLIALLKDKATTDLLKIVWQMTDSDSKTIDPKKSSPLIERAKLLKKNIELYSKAELTLDEWIKQINWMVIEYVEINQALPFSTYSGADRATGHGEGSSNKRFSPKKVEGEIDPKNLSAMEGAAPRYLDLGIFYTDLVRDSIKFSDLAKRQGIKEGPYKAKMVLGKEKEYAKEDKNLTALMLFKSQIELKTFTLNKQKINDTLPVKEYDALTELVREAAYQVKRFKKVQQAAAKVGDEKLDAKDYIKLTTGENAALATSYLIALFDKKKTDAIETRLKVMATNLENRGKMNLGVVKEDFGKLEELKKRLTEPKIYAKTLMENNTPILEKVVGDFYFHLEHFSPAYYGALNDMTLEEVINTKEDEDKKTPTRGEVRKAKFLEAVLFAPLSLSDNRLGAPLKAYMQGDYDEFMPPFRETIQGGIEGWKTSLFKK